MGQFPNYLLIFFRTITKLLKGITLTGSAVNVEAVKTGLVALNTPIVWLFFLIIIGELIKNFWLHGFQQL